MPTARAAATSLAGWSPTCTVAEGSAPAPARAASKIRGSGLATPSTPEMATVANRWSTSWRARMSASQGSKLDTTPRVMPRPASSSRAGRTSSNSW